MFSSAAQTDKTPPPELVKYVRDTKSRGVTDAKIKSQAVAIGWPAATVDEALAYVRTTKASQPKTVRSRGDCSRQVRCTDSNATAATGLGCTEPEANADPPGSFF